MAIKQSKHTGLGEPETEGAAALFEPPKTPVAEEPEKEASPPSPASQKKRTTTKPKEPLPAYTEDRKVKTSFYVSQVALDLLHEMSYVSRKSEGRKIPMSELLDIAIKDLAKKRKVSIASG